jgi:hypothetical protein
VADYKKWIRLSGLPSLKGENYMSVKVPRGTVNGTTHVEESAIG